MTEIGTAIRCVEVGLNTLTVEVLVMLVVATIGAFAGFMWGRL